MAHAEVLTLMHLLNLEARVPAFSDSCWILVIVMNICVAHSMLNRSR